MNEIKDWMWLVKTDKGNFLISVVGKWTQEESKEKVRLAFEKLKLDINAMIPRKRATGPDEAMGTIYQPEELEKGLEFQLYGGKNLWAACGRLVEYEAEKIRMTVGGHANQNPLGGKERR